MFAALENMIVQEGGRSRRRRMRGGVCGEGQYPAEGEDENCERVAGGRRRRRRGGTRRRRMRGGKRTRRR